MADKDPRPAGPTGKSDRLPRQAPLEMSGDDFRKLGHRLVDRIGAFLDALPERRVTGAESPRAIRERLGAGGLPEAGTPAPQLLEEAADLLFEHSLFNGHPRFWGYITSSAAPIGALGDLLAAAVNPNVGAAALSPVASEIEAQTVRWIAELVGFPTTCGGLLVSGGNMANFTCFLAARRARAPWNVAAEGTFLGKQRLIVYASRETHTWLEKAVELFGLGASAVHWVKTRPNQQMDVKDLEEAILADRAAHHAPFMVVGTAGTVSTGVTDPLPALAAVCRRHDLWFHVDGAYGAPAAVLPDASADLLGLREADSLALDPHKWLYSPLEAGCALVRDPRHLLQTFSHHPAYYKFDGGQDEPGINYHEFGLQNSRGFRALKVWLGLRQVGRLGYVQMIGDDIALARTLFEAIGAEPELQAVTRHLSIATFRFVPLDLRDKPDERYLNALNQALLTRLQEGGEVFVSNGVIDGRFVLRACIVNFRTSQSDVEALPKIVVAQGRRLDEEMRAGRVA
jgi:glutamate/tyrosine decarboxylase-like PLP-dependent enzyme